MFFLLVFILSCFVPDAQAEMGITPVLLTIKPQDKLTKVELTNLGKHKRHFQVSIHHWAQKDDQEQLEPAHNWVISPAIFTIESGQSQLIRLAPKEKKIHDKERSFRVLFDEIPQKDLTRRGQVKLNFKISLPLFIEAKSQDQLPIHAKIVKDKLFLSNPNNHHIDLAYLSRDEKQIPIAGYVLAQSEKTIPLTELSSSSGWKLAFGYLNTLMTIDVHS